MQRVAKIFILQVLVLCVKEKNFTRKRVVVFGIKYKRHLLPLSQISFAMNSSQLMDSNGTGNAVGIMEFESAGLQYFV